MGSDRDLGELVADLDRSIFLFDLPSDIRAGLKSLKRMDLEFGNHVENLLIAQGGVDAKCAEIKK